MGTQQKKKKRTKDNRAVISEIKRTQDLDANRLALQPTFEGAAYATVGAGTISFCNVNTTIGPAQTIPVGLPLAPTNVQANVLTNAEQSTITVSWDQAAANPGVTSHKVYYAINAAFTGGATNTVSMPSLSATQSGFMPNRTYYFKVTGVNSNGEGPASATVNELTANLVAFDGTSDFKTTPDAAALDLNNFTVAAWIRTTKDYSIGSPPEGMIINKGGIGSDTAGENMNYGIYMINTNQVRVSFETAAGVDFAATSADVVNTGSTHLIVGTYNGTSLILYVNDDTPVSTATSGAIPETNAKPLVVGRNSRDATRYFEGSIGCAQVWNRAWTAAEVSTYYSNGRSPSGVDRVYIYDSPSD